MSYNQKQHDFWKKKWDEFESKPPMEKMLLRTAWKKYYFKDLPKTKSFLRFKKIVKLLSQKRVSLAKEFCVKAKEQFENQDWELKKPSEYDPFIINYKLAYFAHSKFKEMKDGN